MKKKWILGSIITVLIAFIALPVNAILISIEPSTQDIILGTQPTVDVDVTISGLGDGDTPSLSLYDLDISYDSAVLGFSSVVFGDPVLGNQLDLFGFGSVQDFVPGSGVVNILEISEDFPLDLIDLQAPSFTLASLTFDILGAGVSPFAIDILDLGDELGELLLADVSDGSVTVSSDQAAPVPEPATILLMVSGLFGMGVFGRKKLNK
jgi:hypothetical protein